MKDNVGLLQYLVWYEGPPRVFSRSLYLFSIWINLKSFWLCKLPGHHLAFPGLQSITAILSLPSCLINLWCSKTTWSQEDYTQTQETPLLGDPEYASMSQNSQSARPCPQPSLTNADLSWSFHSNPLNSPTTVTNSVTRSVLRCPVNPDSALLHAKELSSSMSVDSAPSAPSLDPGLWLPTRVFLKTHFLELSPGLVWANTSEWQQRLALQAPMERGGDSFWGATLEPLYQFHFFKKRVLSTSNLLGDVLGAGDAAGSRPGAWLAEIYLSAESQQMNLQTSCLMLGNGTEVVQRRGHSGWVDGQRRPF